MNECERLEAETRQKLQDISQRRKRDILQVYNKFMSCQCAHSIRLETAAYMDARAAYLNLTPAEKVLCALVVVLAALAAYVGYMIKMPGHDCGCKAAEFF